MKVIKVKKADGNFIRVQQWVDSIYKINKQLETVTKKIPEEITESHKFAVTLSLSEIKRRIDMIHKELKNIPVVESYFSIER